MSRLRIFFDLMRGILISIKTRNKLGSILSRGRHNIKINKGKIKLGRRVFLYPNVKLSVNGINKNAELSIGDYTQIGDRTEIHVGNKIHIGNNCSISWDVCILDRDYHYINNIEEAKEIIIKDNVWIGCRSTILKGVTIGEGAVIAAGSIVTKNVPPRSCVAGNPAKIIKDNVVWA